MGELFVLRMGELLSYGWVNTTTFSYMYEAKMFLYLNLLAGFIFGEGEHIHEK